MKYDDTSTIDIMKKSSVKDSGEFPKPKHKKSLVESLGGWTPWWFVPLPINADHSVES